MFKVEEHGNSAICKQASTTSLIMWLGLHGFLRMLLELGCHVSLPEWVVESGRLNYLNKQHYKTTSVESLAPEKSQSPDKWPSQGHNLPPGFDFIQRPKDGATDCTVEDNASDDEVSPPPLILLNQVLTQGSKDEGTDTSSAHSQSCGKCSLLVKPVANCHNGWQVDHAKTNPCNVKTI